MVAKWSIRSQVRIPARDYNIDCSKVEILCRYSKSRAGDMCRLRYRRSYQACPMCLSIEIIPMLQWHRIDVAVVV